VNTIIILFAIFAVSLIVLVIAALLFARLPLQHKHEPVDFEEVDDEREATIGDRKYRSKEGIIWYSFPGGDKVDIDLAEALEYALNKHEQLEKWSGTSRGKKS
jgi:hypothetical protein